MAMKFFVTLVFYLLAWLHAKTQATPDDSDMQLTLEALCSADGAGVSWTIPGSLSHTLEDLNTLTYTCTDASNEQIWTDADDQCFLKQDDTDIVQILAQISPGSSMFHAVSRSLPFGTVCTFNAEYTDGILFERNEIQANCTVGDPGTPRQTVLPATCEFLSDTEECQCPCSEGFTRRIDDSTLNGNLCKEVFSQEVISAEVTPTSVQGTTVSISSETKTSSPPESLHTIAITSSPLLPTESSPVLPVSSPPVKPSTSSPSMPVSSSPAMLSTPHQPTDPIPPSNDNLKLALTIIPTAVIIISVMTLVLVVIECRKYRLKRKHEKLAMPFYELRFEKIDPDFNPIKIDERILVSESMHSIFHTFGSLDHAEEGKEKQTETKEDYLTDNDSESVILTETNLFTGNVTVTETESEETILKDEESQDSTGASSGYVTDSVIYDSLCQQTDDYLESEQEAHQSEHFTAVASTFSNDVKLPVTNVEVSQSKYMPPGMALYNGCQDRVHSIDKDYPTTGSESGYVTTEQVTGGYVAESDHLQSMKETGYVTDQDGPSQSRKITRYETDLEGSSYLQTKATSYVTMDLSYSHMKATGCVTEPDQSQSTESTGYVMDLEGLPYSKLTKTTDYVHGVSYSQSTEITDYVTDLDGSQSMKAAAGSVTDLDRSGPSYLQSMKATEYILPSFCTPDVFFNFPNDMT